ncbi:putative 2-aminoethylphosphonate ABC transporter permease subunit [Paenibacillus sp. N1-5-1-14]|uniref:putative 2-aminoethylphosphonate ABC transporter permease subunit n=1 Tax=Paenibacillus radicibacter TaxID=2972488 RepID=UPI002158C608|nr:putative 2-aminoethylphosphonate ABC transporter permease subunit [Paenibacillus radicibacter]MCR8643076.1 putative 2-aminoethylphosphonate ABC transporter permease subunit [Paenibacillus radicibacter]
MIGGKSVRQRRGGDQWLQTLLMVIMIVILFVSILLPLYGLFSKAFTDENGQFIGISNFIHYFDTPALAQSFNNTLYISSVTTVITVILAFAFAYAINRSQIRGKMLFRYIALLPLFAPTMMHGIALTYLFGKQGLITTGFFGALPFSWDIGLYGATGIIISEVIYAFPQAFLILSVALAVSDNRLYEAAETLGAGQLRKFATVTLPNMKYGLVSAIFVCFTISFTDFGAPKVVGGQFNVLATDIYKQVVGQQNMGMGATVGILLTLPALLAFIVDRFVERKQSARITAKSTPYRIQDGRMRDTLSYVYCILIVTLILILNLTVILAAFIKVWPYQLSLTWKHFDFTQTAGEGLTPFWNSLTVSIYTAVIGTMLTFGFAYLIEKIRFWRGLRQVGYFLSIIPLALPGMVIGLAYIFFFNNPDNPLHAIYGTAIIIVLANIVHFYSVPFITATTALKKLDKEFELVSESMRVPFYKTFFRVTVPMSLPAILEIASYFFVNAMVTISAVVFLYAADFKLASVAIVNMDDAGDIAPAAAMSLLILVTNILVRILYEVVTRNLRKRTEAWQNTSHKM